VFRPERRDWLDLTQEHHMSDSFIRKAEWKRLRENELTASARRMSKAGRSWLASRQGLRHGSLFAVPAQNMRSSLAEQLDTTQELLGFVSC
jgi:hypothetical protein